MTETDFRFDEEWHKHIWELYDEIVMLLATELGLDINTLMAPVIEEGGGWTFLLDDLIAAASPLKNPRIVKLLKEYDELERPARELLVRSLA